MAILASAILTEVGIQMHDSPNTRWTPDEVFGYVNDAQRAIATLRPDATKITKPVKLVPGVTQRIPADGYIFLKLFENLGPNGDSAPVPGRTVEYRDLGAMQRHSPKWRMATPKAEVREYTVDTVDRQTFFVSPPVHPSTAVWVNEQYSREPVSIPLSTDSPSYQAAHNLLDVPDIYKPALLQYVFFRCHAKNNEASNMAKAQVHGNSFLAMMGAKGRSDVLYSVDTRDRPYSDNPPRPEAVSN